MNSPDGDRLARSIHDLLRTLPPVAAPSTLEARILREIDRRASLPWWRRSFPAWPAPARLAFVILSAVALGFCLLPVVMQPAVPVAAAGFLESAGVLAADLRNLASALGVAATAAIGWIRPVWLYGAAALLFISYAGLFCIGAAAWRTLHTRT